MRLGIEMPVDNFSKNLVDFTKKIVLLILTMTTIAQLIEHLKTLPPDAQVRVLATDNDGPEITTKWVDLEFNTNCFFWGDNCLDLGQE